MTGYEFRPEYQQVIVSGNEAIVYVNNDVRIEFFVTGDSKNLDSTDHILTLRKRADGWKLTKDEYSDELTAGFPADGKANGNLTLCSCWVQQQLQPSLS